MGKAGSRLGNDMSSELVHSLIIADANKVAGEKIDAVADRLCRGPGRSPAGRALSIATTRRRHDPGPDGGRAAHDRPEAATPADLALLTARYSVSPRESGTQQRAEIARALRNAVAGADKDPTRSNR